MKAIKIQLKGRRRGRKSKLTPELIQSISELVKKGISIAAVCGSVGISERVFYQWMVRAEEGQQPYTDFQGAVKRAEGHLELTLIQAIEADKSWIAKAWLLERKWPDRYGRKDKVIHEGGDKDKPIKLIYEEIVTDKREDTEMDD